MKIYLGGTFDIPHYGHIKFFETARKIAQTVVVALNTDSFVLQYKGKLPVMSYKERKEIIESCMYVSKVVPNAGGYDSSITIEQEMPDYILHGDDWIGDEYLKQLGITQEWLDDRHITLLYTPYNKLTSTTNIKNIIKTI